MKKIRKHKQDILICLLFSIIYIVIALILTHGEFLFASKVDFAMQHYNFPDYFRELFYRSKDLFPDLALNLGGGQNIYNLSYYGFLSPIIMVSYLLPMIPMIYYLIATSFIIVVLSTFLFYKFLLKHHINNKTALVVSLLFLFASPIIYHAKRHIMFIYYFPFLILGLFGVDKFLKEKKISLLTLSVLLMILTSFYYSVGGIIVLIIYGLYQFIGKDKTKPKEIIKFLCSFVRPFIIAVLISAILWLPTLYTLVAGRAGAIKEIEYLKLFIPNFKFLYRAYGPGLTFLEFILIGILVIDKKIRKKTRLLALTIIIIFIFPIFNYILNGTLYINTKSLIPFLPLALYLVAISLDTLLRHNKKIKVYLLLSTCIICIVINFSDPLIPKEELTTKEENHQYLVDKITNSDTSFYRIGNNTETSTALNKVYNLEEYKTSIYSSTENHYYQYFVNKKQQSNQIYRNHMMLSISGDILTEGFMGEKYIVSDEELKDGYQKLETKGDLSLYQNEFALPIVYKPNTTLSKEEYKNLEYPKNIIASYLNDQKVKDINLGTTSFTLKDKKNIEYEIEENSITIKANKKNKVTLTPKESLDGKIVFISFKNAYNKRCNHTKIDQTITINDVKNKLTCKGWKYHNRNKVFHYTLVSPEELEITFSDGYYKLEDIKIYTIDKNVLLQKQNEITSATIKRENIKQDEITGTISGTKGEVLTTIPYDEGFKVEVDNKEVPYKKSIQNTISFEVEKGLHTFTITYQAPWKNVGIILSLTGIILWLGFILKEKKKK